MVVTSESLNVYCFPIVTETPSETAQRTLKLIAKALQNLANLVEFVGKEPYMYVVNPFIVANKPRMVEFLDQLSVSTVVVIYSNLMFRGILV